MVYNAGGFDMNKLIVLILAFTLALTLVGCDNEKHAFQGEIIEIDNGTMLVEPLEGYSEAKHAQRIRVEIQSMPGSPEPRVGDIIEVTYSGVMTEVSPPSPVGVERIVVIERNQNDTDIKEQNSLTASKVALNFTEEITVEKNTLDSCVIYDRDNAIRTYAGNFSFQNVSPGFSAISDVLYSLDHNMGSFSFVITWVDTGNPISVGLLNEENEAFMISLEGGTSSCNIDISGIPNGKYYVIVMHQGKYEPVVNGAISYNFSEK